MTISDERLKRLAAGIAPTKDEMLDLIAAARLNRQLVEAADALEYLIQDIQSTLSYEGTPESAQEMVLWDNFSAAIAAAKGEDK